VLPRVRSGLLGLTLFGGLLLWVAFSLGLDPYGGSLVLKLRVVVGVTWLYALAHIVDLKVWRSRIAQRRRAASRIPESLEGWLFGQLMAWSGMAYYGLTDDLRWFAAGVVLLLLSFALFPIEEQR
jgi:hypothetical protein